MPFNTLTVVLIVLLLAAVAVGAVRLTRQQEKAEEPVAVSSIHDFTMESIDGLDATLEEFTLAMRAYSSEYINGVLFDPSEDCEPFETLEFGVV